MAPADDRRVEHLVDKSPTFVMLNLALRRHSGLGNAPSCTHVILQSKAYAMRLFKSDLYRNFAIGFVVGAAIVGAQADPQVWEQIIPQAQAQTASPASPK